MKPNAVVAQSGGPSSVINATLQGIIHGCEKSKKFGTLYGAWQGILGMLREELINLSKQPKDQIELLKTTPSAGYIGSCRYKLKDDQNEDFDRLIQVFKENNIRYFFYIGGGDSMRTANKVATLAHNAGLTDFVAIGVPKTVDNDLGTLEIIDHTPGYGSAARRIALDIHDFNQESLSTPWFGIRVYQVMGRKISYLPAAAEFARKFNPNQELPLKLLLPQSGYSLDDVADIANEQLRQYGRSILVVSEGFIDNLDVPEDMFGNEMYTTLQESAASKVVEWLNKVKLAVDYTYASADIVNSSQRNDIKNASEVDIAESYQVGREAVNLALEEGNGWMPTIIRVSDYPYEVEYDKVALEVAAGKVSQFPEKWLTEDKLNVTEDFFTYAAPLIGTGDLKIPKDEYGAPVYAVLNRDKGMWAIKKLDDYIPQKYRMVA